MSKLGLHFQNLPSWHRNQRTPWVKMIDPPTTNPWPWARVLGRVWIGGDHIEQFKIWRGKEGAQEYYRVCSPVYERAPYVHAWEGPNEPHPLGDANFRRALSVFTIEWTRLMQTAGRRVIVGCFSVGWPDVGHAPEFASMLAAADYFGLREYGAPAMWDNEGRHCLRYRRTVTELQAVRARIPPIVIGECGIDGGVIGPDTARRGWRSFASRGQYQQQLAWYDERLREDELVWCATPFVSGPERTWVDFDYDEDLARWTAARHATMERPAPRAWTPAPRPPAPAPRPPAPPSPPSLDPAVVRRHFTAASFDQHVAGLKVREPYTRVCIHHTASPTVARWQQFGGAHWIGNAARRGSLERHYRAAPRNWTRFPHVFAAPDGIWVLGNLELDGAGVSGHNRGVRHIEIVGDYSNELPSGPTLENAVAAAATLLQKAGLRIDALTYHRAMRANTACPGAALIAKWDWFRGLVEARLPRAPDALPEGVEKDIWNVMQQHIIPINPDAALEKAGAKRGFLPASHEVRDVPGIVAQAFRGVKDRTKQYIAYCLEGDWDNVRWIEGGSDGR